MKLHIQARNYWHFFPSRGFDLNIEIMGITIFEVSMSGGTFWIALMNFGVSIWFRKEGEP